MALAVTTVPAAGGCGTTASVPAALPPAGCVCYVAARCPLQLDAWVGVFAPGVRAGDQPVHAAHLPFPLCAPVFPGGTLVLAAWRGPRFGPAFACGAAAAAALPLCSDQLLHLPAVAAGAACAAFAAAAAKNLPAALAAGFPPAGRDGAAGRHRRRRSSASSASSGAGDSDDASSTGPGLPLTRRPSLGSTDSEWDHHGGERLSPDDGASELHSDACSSRSSSSSCTRGPAAATRHLRHLEDEDAGEAGEAAPADADAEPAIHASDDEHFFGDDDDDDDDDDDGDGDGDDDDDDDDDRGSGDREECHSDGGSSLPEEEDDAGAGRERGEREEEEEEDAAAGGSARALGCASQL